MSSNSIDTSFFLRMGEGPEGWGFGFENSLVVSKLPNYDFLFLGFYVRGMLKLFHLVIKLIE